MRAEIEQAIRVLQEKILAKEEEAKKLKRVVNGFYTDENEPPPYADVESESTASLGNLRTDHFYGSTLAEAAQAYLEMRKARGLGSASVNEIYKTLKEGGYAFETSIEENAKNGVRISLKKNSTIFHQLPSGDYGLCVWYGVKGKNEPAPITHRRISKAKKRSTKSKPDSEKTKSDEESAQNGATDTNSAMRNGHGIAGNGGVITVGDFEAFIREKSRRIKDVVDHFHVEEAMIKSLLEPASNVYQAERGWLKIHNWKKVS